MSKFRFDSQKSGLFLEMSPNESFIDYAATAVFIGYAGYFLYTIVNKDLSLRTPNSYGGNAFIFKNNNDTKGGKKDDQDDAYLNDNGWTKL